MAYLRSQAHRVEHNQQEHEVLKVAGSDDIPDLVLVRVLGNVAAQRPSLESILHTLALKDGEQDVHHHVFVQADQTFQALGTFIGFKPDTLQYIHAIIVL